MVNNQYFSHINLEGKTPQDRAISAGIDQRVDEMIVMNLNLTEAYF